MGNVCVGYVTTGETVIYESCLMGKWKPWKKKKYVTTEHIVNKEFGASEIVVSCCIGLQPHISITVTIIIILVTTFVQGI